MEREVGGGIGMGNTCKPLAVSFQCMTKSTTNKKKINKKKIKKKKKKKKLTFNIIPHGEKPQVFPLRSGTRHRYLLSSLLFSFRRLMNK